MRRCDIAQEKAQGHYCKICGQRKSNESFSGKGHATHICKVCSRLTPAEQSEEMTLNRLMNLPMLRLTDAEKKWLKNRTHDEREAVRTAATQIYKRRFPHAERNTMKKQLRINEVIFTVNTALWDEDGDEISACCKFELNRKESWISKRQSASDEPDLIEMDGPELAKLLKWMLHSLEIFCWDEDYCSHSSDDSFDYDSDIDELAEEFGGEIIETDEIPGTIDEGEPTWSVWLKYADGHEQSIICHEDGLPDRVEELYQELAEYFPESDEDDEFDFLEQVYGCADLVELKNLVAALLEEAERSGDDSLVTLAWMDLIMAAENNLLSANEGKRAYHIHSGAVANAGFLLSFVMQTHPEQVGVSQTGRDKLAAFAEYMSENIAPPIGNLISVSEIDKTINAIEKKYKLISRLFQQEKLTILRMRNSHKTFNSICNAIRLPTEPPKFHYELYLFHQNDPTAGHPVYIFLHELGHILQTEVTRDSTKVPESFCKLSDKITGKQLEQGDFAPELFADAFSMAMMQTFGWEEYDSFHEVAPEVKNAFRVYMDWLIEKLFAKEQ